MEAITCTGDWRGITIGLEAEDMCTADSKLCRRAGFRFKILPPWMEGRWRRALPTVGAGLGEAATAGVVLVVPGVGRGRGMEERVSLGKVSLGKYFGEGTLKIGISFSKNKVSSWTMDLDNR